MRTSRVTLAIVIVMASPLTWAQGRDAATAPTAAAQTSPVQPANATADHASKSKSAFGRAIADMVSALRETKVRDTQLAQGQSAAAAVQPPTVDAGTAVAIETRATGRAVERVAVQSESDVPN